jgi:hypothetical protein
MAYRPDEWLTSSPAPKDISNIQGDIIWCEKNALHWESCLPQEPPLPQVRCRSVFTPTKWTTRALSQRELSIAYDVPRSLMTGAVPCNFFEHPTATPTKLLATALSSWSICHQRDSNSLGAAPDQTIGVPASSVPANSPRPCLDRAPGLCMQGAPSDQSRGELTSVNMNPSQLPSDNTSGPYMPTGVSWEDGAVAAAVKADNATANTVYWDRRIWALGLHTQATYEAFHDWRVQHGRLDRRCPLDILRELCLHLWWRHIMRCFAAYMVAAHGDQWCRNPAARDDQSLGSDCLRRCSGADWWEWRAGSTPFFWQWPPYAREYARTGHPVWVKAPLPQDRRPQKGEKDQGVRAAVRAKLQNVRSKGYVTPGTVISLTSYFYVPKGEHDIRMVYDATRSGLNKCLWVPSFNLPTADSFTDCLEAGSWMMDLDLGEMFLNFPLNPQLRSYCGIDLRPFFSEEAGDQTLWQVWVRCMMGLMTSPYCTVKTLLLGYESVVGDRHDPNNSFQWDRVVLNLPGGPTYSPTLPWVYRTRDTGRFAGVVKIYVDDLRPVAESEHECWTLGHQAATRLQHLGIQISSRKTRPPSQTPRSMGGHCGSNFQ